MLLLFSSSKRARFKFGIIVIFAGSLDALFKWPLHFDDSVELKSGYDHLLSIYLYMFYAFE